jgi:hypothetical protein
MLHPSLLKDLSLLIETIWTLTLRLIKTAPRGPTASAAESGGTAQAKTVSYSPGTQPFQEMLQHAHRTQSSSD